MLFINIILGLWGWLFKIVLTPTPNIINCYPRLSTGTGHGRIRDSFVSYLPSVGVCIRIIILMQSYLMIMTIMISDGHLRSSPKTCTIKTHFLFIHVDFISCKMTTDKDNYSYLADCAK